MRTDPYERSADWQAIIPAIEYKLIQLRAEIATLRKLPALSLEFTTWLSKLFTLVEAGFCIDSDEMHSLRAISPELPSEFYDSVADRLSAGGLSEKWKDHLLTKLNKTYLKHFSGVSCTNTMNLSQQ